MVRGIVFLTTLCIVKAAVVITLYNDVTEGDAIGKDIKEVNNSLINNSEEPTDCSSLKCKIMCKQDDSPGGTCERGVCNCDKFEGNDKKSQPIYLQECDFIACSIICSKSNFIGGFCQDGYCYCF